MLVSLLPPVKVQPPPKLSRRHVLIGVLRGGSSSHGPPVAAALAVGRCPRIKIVEKQARWRVGRASGVAAGNDHPVGRRRGAEAEATVAGSEVEAAAIEVESQIVAGKVRLQHARRKKTGIYRGASQTFRYSPVRQWIGAGEEAGTITAPSRWHLRKRRGRQL